MQHTRGKMKGISPMSQQFMNQQALGMGRINEPQPVQMIDRPDWINRGNVIHNNMGQSLLSEHLMEYKIHVDSADRDTTTYPSPFKMKVAFGLAKNSQAPLLPRTFKNIKYITLDSIILPRTLAIDLSNVDADIIYPAGSTYPTLMPAPVPNKSSILENHKYIIVKIDELSTEKNMGTSTLLDRDTFAFIPDTDLGLDSVLYKPMHNNRVIYQNGFLSNVSSLTISVLDEYGNLLKLIDETGANINYNDYNEYIKNNLSEESVAYTNSVSGVTYNFTFGVIENEMNVLTNY